jgi:glycerol-3-phosphate acyltransferase PlsX
VKNTIGQIRELLASKSADQLVTYFAEHGDQMAALKESLK